VPLSTCMRWRLTLPVYIALEVVEHCYTQPHGQPVGDVITKPFWKGAYPLPVQDSDPQED